MGDAGFGDSELLECVVNISEGRDEDVLGRIVEQSQDVLLDVHRDPSHNRAVITLGGRGLDVERAARTVTVRSVDLLDLAQHRGAHPRFGVVDVVPFVPLFPSGTSGTSPTLSSPDLDRAVAARDRFAAWAGGQLGLPCFIYGPLPGGGERTLPQIRRTAFRQLRPDTGPDRPDPHAGAVAVGARAPLVAYNLWIAGADVEMAREVASAIRGPHVRALGLDLEGDVQVSCNLVNPGIVGPAQVYDAVSALLRERGARIGHAELVGLAPATMIQAVPESRWHQLDLSPTASIEARLEEREAKRR
jgi:glutamate formiminotransferase